MIIDIEADGPVPIYEQITAQVIYAIASGALGSGAEMPSVRRLAEQQRINPNTVVRAFQELERAGIVAARRGLPMEVTAEAPAVCRVRREEMVRQRVRAALREAVASALPAEQIRELVEDELARANGHKRPREKH
ncbi:MAG: GntR family transcriptional regulator [Gemmataceae bacterium]|nr:GntR family transcriptional regulator [Gemmataceae bacterium]